ncbi:adenosine deaminase [Xylona heveae TC161]|uniref:Adenosine deaminase n=1 Tax=Xylona heveae (strain CBS 132557 / TC161) TaxID=1328760 RepID=A0A165GRQ4_XYLHT|nr:adenosine deaminase [Xylona heveae TC161]KZF22511.1 adenosine deaminase [Xylona heveae TC161]
MPAPSYEDRQEWRRQQLEANDQFVVEIPKVELHVHIEGTMTPELRWQLSLRNGIPLAVGPQKTVLDSLEKVRQIYKQIRGRIGAASADQKLHFTFFEAYYGGFDLLQTEQDYYELAMNYFERAAQMNVRYCEPFFDIQGHSRRGIPVTVVMNGFKKAQIEAEERLNVKSQWIMCMLRDMSPESAMENYIAALPFRDMIVGIGLDSDEKDHPPSLFKELFLRARADGFKLTSHCDFHQKDTHDHIRQVVEEVGGKGADRIDHGMNATDRSELMGLIKERDIGMTVCPCAYIRHQPVVEVFPRIRKLFDAGIKVTIASDDPAYMEDNWVLHNLLMARDKCSFTDKEIVQLQRNAVSICWAPENSKQTLLHELDAFAKSYSV